MRYAPDAVRADRRVHAAEALLLRAVHVLRDAPARLCTGADESVRDRRRDVRMRPRNSEGSCAPAELVLAQAVALGFTKVRQALRIAPPRNSLCLCFSNSYSNFWLNLGKL